MKLKNIISQLESDCEYYKKVIEGWKVRLDKDPLYAFEWADGTIRAAASLAISSQVLNALKDSSYEESYEELRSYLINRVLTEARWPSASTSGVSNISKEYEKAARAALVAPGGIFSNETVDN